MKIERIAKQLNLSPSLPNEAFARVDSSPEVFASQLDQLVALFDLNELDQTLVIVLVLDTLTAGGLGFSAQSLERQSLVLAGALGLGSNRILSSTSPLQQQNLIAVYPSPHLPPEILAFLLGQSTIPHELTPLLREVSVTKTYEIWPDDTKLSNLLTLDNFISFIYTDDLSQDLAQLNLTLRKHRRRCFELDLEIIAKLSPKEIQRLHNTIRLHRGCAALIVRKSANCGDLEFVVQNLNQIPLVHLIESRDIALPDTCRAIELTSPRQSSRLWRLEATARALPLESATLDALASVFPFTLNQIENVFDQLAIENGKSEYHDLAKICRRKSSRELEKLARKVEPKYRWEDLMMPPTGKLKLAEIYHYIAGRSRTDRDWNLRQRHNRGHGVTIVLKGASGTGKTMAAEVLAGELGLDLYQVDLSSLTSKYIGETEKNLARIFQAARACSGILLFDEGEVLFGQRTDVSSSQDKYANLEVNFLLQELEAFDGIVIISTNQARAIDSAFLRRVTFDVEVPRPDDAARRAIWSSHLAGGLPLAADLDFDFLATLLIPGGLIRNIVKQATSLASQFGDELRMADVLHAVKREFNKIGEPIEREVFGEAYWPMVSNEWEAIYARKRRDSLLERPRRSRPANAVSN